MGLFFYALRRGWERNFKSRGDVALLCFSSLFFHHDDDKSVHLHRTYDGAVRGYLESCEKVFADLDPGALEVLRPMLGKPLDWPVLYPLPIFPGVTRPEYSWSNHTRQNQTQEELRQAVKDGSNMYALPRDRLPAGLDWEGLRKKMEGFFDDSRPG